MEQILSAVAELRSLAAAMNQLSSELDGEGQKHSAKTVRERSIECQLMAELLEVGLKGKDGGTALRIVVPAAEESTLWSAVFLIVMWADLLVPMNLKAHLKEVHDRTEALMWKFDKLGKQLPLPAPQSAN